MTKKPSKKLSKKHIAAIIMVTIAVIIIGGIFLKLYVFTPLNKAVWRGEDKIKEYGLTGTVTLSEERELKYIHYGASWPWDIYFVTCDIEDLDSLQYGTIYSFVKSTQRYGEKDGSYQISTIIKSGGKEYRVTDGSLYIDGEKAYDDRNHGIGRVPTTKETTKVTEETTSIIVPPQPAGSLPTYDSDPFYVNNYDDPDEFYYWNYDDFYDYEEAEEYFYSHRK